MSERYDIAIVGSGPAGLSAALNAKIRKKKFIIFGSKETSNIYGYSSC
jgi:thioredoxin reductase (NADPH)